MLGDIEETTAPFGILDVMGDGSTVEEIHHPLPAVLSARIRQVARAQGVSAASVFHLAWALVLSAASGQSSPVFGTVLFGRMGGVEGADQAMGMFINTLPVRIDVGRVSAQEALKATHARLTALLRHEHASLSQAQRCSSVPAGAPLFTAMLNYRYIAKADPAEDARVWAGMSVLGGEERTNIRSTCRWTRRATGSRWCPRSMCALARHRLPVMCSVHWKCWSTAGNKQQAPAGRAVGAAAGGSAAADLAGAGSCVAFGGV